MPSPPLFSRMLVRSVAALLLLPAAARADLIPLPPALQTQVDKSIDAGVGFLKAMQGPAGTWANDDQHKTGYAALPGLTLLECGVSAKDPAVQRAAQYVRWAAPNLDATYELALSILFLDRLGDPKDRALIQVLALRLVAGQAASGGWGYKCPLLNTTDHQQLFALLRKLEPPALFDPLAMPKIDPNLAKGMPQPGFNGPNPLQGPNVALLNPLGNNLPLNNPLMPNQPGLVNPLGNMPPGSAHTPSNPGSAFTPAAPVNPLASVVPAVDPGTKPLRGETPAPQPTSTTPNSSGYPVQGIKPAIGDDTAKTRAPEPDFELRPVPTGTFPSKNWAWCIKMDGMPDWVRPKPDPKQVAKKKVQVPANLAHLPVVNDPNQLPLFDPPSGKDEKQRWEVVFPRTDNSNTHLAILALWSARRYDVPMTRTLNLVSRRFYTSQNGDGSWSYDYSFGGNDKGGDAMHCVGLLGLAIAHGLAGEEGAARFGRGAPDPRIVQGFVALSQKIGQPTGRMQNIKQPNLYYLWAIERVGVLYNLKTIGEKDWYRWGAEALVANQKQLGYWDNGGYPGVNAKNPTVDTCFALLFLKRANLATDLSKLLPFDPLELAQAIIAALPVDPGQVLAMARGRSTAKPGPRLSDPSPPLKMVNPLGPPGLAKEYVLASATPVTMLPLARPTSDTPEPPETPPSPMRAALFWIFLVLVVLLSLGTIVFMLVKAVRDRKDEEDEEEDDRRASRRKRQSR